jgi:hypothetical protein
MPCDGSFHLDLVVASDNIAGIAGITDEGSQALRIGLNADPFRFVLLHRRHSAVLEESRKSRHTRTHLCIRYGSSDAGHGNNRNDQTNAQDDEQLHEGETAIG